MRNLLLITLLFIIVGCNNTSKPTNIKYTLNYGDGKGWSRRTTVVICDSFKMISPKEVIFWNDGKMGNILSDEVILINSINR